QPKRLEWEKESLGLFFSDHPFQEAARWLAERQLATTAQLGPELANERVKIAGVISSVKRITTRRKERMAVAVLEDLHGAVDVTVFPRTFAQTEQLWQDDAIVIVDGKLSLREDRLQIICDAAELFEAPEGQPPEAERTTDNGRLGQRLNDAEGRSEGSNGWDHPRSNGAAASANGAASGETARGPHDDSGVPAGVTTAAALRSEEHKRAEEDERSAVVLRLTA